MSSSTTRSATRAARASSVATTACSRSSSSTRTTAAVPNWSNVSGSGPTAASANTTSPERRPTAPSSTSTSSGRRARRVALDLRARPGDDGRAGDVPAAQQLVRAVHGLHRGARRAAGRHDAAAAERHAAHAQARRGRGQVERDGGRQRVQLAGADRPGLPARRSSGRPRVPSRACSRRPYLAGDNASIEEAGRAIASCSRSASAPPRSRSCATGPTRQRHPLPGPHRHPQRARLRQRERDAAALRRTSTCCAAGSRAVAAGRLARRGADNEIDAAGRVMMPGPVRHARPRGPLGRRRSTSPPASPPCATWATTTPTHAGDARRRSPPATLLEPQIVPRGFLEGESPFSARIGFVDQATLDEAKDAIDWYAAARLPAAEDLQLVPAGDPERDRRLRPQPRHARERPRAGLHARAGRGRRGLRRDPAHQPGACSTSWSRPRPTRARSSASPAGGEGRRAGFRLAAGAAISSRCWRAGRPSSTRRWRRSTSCSSGRRHVRRLRRRGGPPAAGRPARLLRRQHGHSRRRHRRALQASYAKMVEFVGRLYRAGVPIVAGTDAMPGFTLQRELELYVKAGMTPAQALQIATRNGARYTGTQPRARQRSRRASSPTWCWWTAIRPRTSPTCARSRS